MLNYGSSEKGLPPCLHILHREVGQLIGRDLVGKTAVVTGSSSGIGRAIALELGRSGANVLVHARSNGELAQGVAEQLRGCGVISDVVLYDFTDTTHQDCFLQEAFSWRNGVDIWINNAGADVLTGAAAEESFDAKLERLWRVDLLSTIRLAREAGNRMVESGGVIVNSGWDQAEVGMAGDSGEMFAAIKGAIMAFSRSLAKSLAPHVRVNCIAPGWIKTAWGEQASASWRQRAEQESLLGRWGTPQDVARTVHFLVSPEGDFINGQVILVNGGFQTGSTSE